MQILLGGGVVAMPGWVLQRPELSWLAFYGHMLLLLISLIAGMYREAKALGMLDSQTAMAWRSTLEQYINYETGRIDPAVKISNLACEPSEKGWVSAMKWFGGALGVNVYWLFEYYGGGGSNAAFFVAPIATGAFAYVDWKFIGPIILRLLLVRNLEKDTGRRFINADFAQIQELRRTFFLSRWLMKDYVSTKAVLPVRRSTVRSGKRK
jgi:hypothetical protein